LTSIILGGYVFHKTKDKLAALLVQLTGLIFLVLPSFNNIGIPILPVVANVCPEPLFISIINIFTLYLLKLYFSENSAQKLRHTLVLAFICGLGLAVKINFFSVFLSALMLVPLRNKILFIVVCMVSFVFFTIPIIENYPWIYHWFSGMVVHSSRYGSGSGKFIDWGSFFLFFKFILHSFVFFVFSAAGLWIWCSVRMIKDRRDQNARFIWALSFCALLHFAATAKHFSNHYLLPGLGLFSPIFLLFYLDLKDKYRFVKPLTAAFILIFISISAFYTIPYYKQLLVLSEDVHDLKSRLHSQYPQCTVIPSTTMAINLYLSKEQALVRGDGTAANMESDELSRLYPHAYFFFSEEIGPSPDPNVESYGIWDFKQRIFADDLMAACPCVIFIKYLSDFSMYPYQVRLVDHSKYLNAYLLLGSTEKEATGLFAQTLDAFNNGNFEKAFFLGLKSRQLNYEPKGQLEYLLSMIYQDLLKSRVDKPSSHP